MSNEINIQNTLGTNRVSNSGNKVESGSAKDSSANAPKTESRGSETVSVSADYARLGEISSRLAALPEVDATKVAEIKQALADGSLTIDAEKVAASILDFESSYGPRDS